MHLQIKVGQGKETAPAAPAPATLGHGPGHGNRPKAPPPILTAAELKASIAEAQAAKAAQLAEEEAREALAVEDDVVGVAELLEGWATDSLPHAPEHPPYTPSTFRREPAPAPDLAMAELELEPWEEDPEADRTEL